eukprot:760884-Hanusia_phi.AAC.1
MEGLRQEGSGEQSSRCLRAAAVGKVESSTMMEVKFEVQEEQTLGTHAEKMSGYAARGRWSV